MAAVAANRGITTPGNGFQWPWLLVAAGWGVALTATAGGQDWVLNHHELIEGGRLPLLVAGLIFLLAWQLMTITMMLPSSMATLSAFRQANCAGHGGRVATVAFLAGYMGIWTWYGGMAFVGDILIHGLIHQWSWLAWHPWTIAGTTLLTAGAFQFTPIKVRCLAECRDHHHPFLRHSQGGGVNAWWFGLKHGMSCLGDCWALMLVMFGLGVGNVLWMAGLGGLMLLERASSFDRLLVPIVGAAFLTWGALVLAHPNWLPSILVGGA